jgi:GNAT superfamily N-acetyltransferase
MSDPFCLNFRGANIGQLALALDAMGVPLESEPTIRPDGSGSIQLRDPDDHLIFLDTSPSELTAYVSDNKAEESPSVFVTRTTSESAGFTNLVEELTKFLAVLNGEQDSFYAKHNKSDGISTVVVAYIDNQAVGCGAFRWVEEGTVEIKRMYVDPAYRGKGVGGYVLRELEVWAKEHGAKRSILETSKRLGAAVHLYQKSGYQVIANYDPYVGVEDSVCFSKNLQSA